MRLYGITGWKNSGKTGLMERLVAEISARGFSVSTIKHTHHAVDMETQGSDTWRHRAAGARQVMLASSARWALLHEWQQPQNQEPDDVMALAARMDAVDLILAEGFKTGPHPKIETFRTAAGTGLLAQEDRRIRAVASDGPLPSARADLRCYDLNDTGAIADFILTETGLSAQVPAAP
ncbi:MAG: molybdopterin-guanine dinucleotide biosynthesis protein B [Rhodobacteraceae bacterium]|nr:molybdopterin-guanine dinucleotide biosynthesis protein B [Paracoccaceae bacterium]